MQPVPFKLSTLKLSTLTLILDADGDRGIYVDDDERWPRHFRGMGIRIEDSVCIHEDTCVVLTTEAVKEVRAAFCFLSSRELSLMSTQIKAVDIEALREWTNK